MSELTESPSWDLVIVAVELHRCSAAGHHPRVQIHHEGVFDGESLSRRGRREPLRSCGYCAKQSRCRLGEYVDLQRERESLHVPGRQHLRVLGRAIDCACKHAHPVADPSRRNRSGLCIAEARTRYHPPLTDETCFILEGEARGFRTGSPVRRSRKNHTERWSSGRRHSLGKRADVKASRGFESLPLRFARPSVGRTSCAANLPPASCGRRIV